MVTRRVSSRWATRDQAVRDVHASPWVDSEKFCGSDSLFIRKVFTAEAGTYFVVIQSDCVFPEDVDALERLDCELGSPWRTMILESQFYGRPSPCLSMSSFYWVHTVHPNCPPGLPRRTALVRSIRTNSYHDPLGLTGRAVSR